jgi:hypothetical protein
VLADEVLRTDMVTTGKATASTELMPEHIKENTAGENEARAHSFIQTQRKTFSGMEDKCLVTLSAQ